MVHSYQLLYNTDHVIFKLDKLQVLY